MTRRTAPALVTMLLGIAALTGCGDDDDSSLDGSVRDAAAESSEGSAGTAGRRANAAGGSGAGGRRAAPSAGDGGASGRGGGAGAAGDDTAASGTGGRRAADGGAAGRVAQSVRPSTDENDEQGCPALNFGGLLVLPSCCTTRHMCGVDTSTVGGPGCLDLATAADSARMAGASVVFPAPRACEAVISDADAGVETLDDAGSL